MVEISCLQSLKCLILSQMLHSLRGNQKEPGHSLVLVIKPALQHRATEITVLLSTSLPN